MVDYCDSVWDNNTAAQDLFLEKLHFEAIRVITGLCTQSFVTSKTFYENLDSLDYLKTSPASPTLTLGNCSRPST